MLYNMASFLHKKKRLDGIHHGVVVANTDPKGLGHIKVKVDDVLEGDVDSLPWVAPKLPTFLGGANNVACFSVPNVGSTVLVEFFDIYTIYYTGVIPNSQHLTDGKIGGKFGNKTSPSKYGIVDDEGTVFEVDRENDVFHVHHKQTHLYLRNNHVELTTPHNTNVTSSKAITANGQTITATGSSSVRLVCGGSSITITSGNITLNSASIDLTNSSSLA